LNAITNDLWFRHGCGLIFELQPKINNVMKQIFTFSLAVVTTLTLFSGCKKAECNDPDATNYNADAGKDDGSCTYEGSVVFWYNAATADFMESLGVTELSFYVDNDLVGTRSIADFYTVQPNCGYAGSVTLVKSLGDKKSRNFLFSIEDQNNFLLDEGLLGIRDNECTAYRLE